MPVVSKVHQAFSCITCDSSSPSPNSELFWNILFCSLLMIQAVGVPISGTEVTNTEKSGGPWSVAWSQAGKAESGECWKLLRTAKQPPWQVGGMYVTLTPALVHSRAGKDRPNCTPSAASSSKSAECFPRDCRATGPNSCRSGWPQRCPLQWEL